MSTLLKSASALLALLFLAAGCGSGYLGRMVWLRTPDVEDYRKLPLRAVPNGLGARPWSARPEPGWIDRAPLSHAGRTVTTSSQLDTLLQANGTTAFLLVADGRLVDERYYDGYRRDSLWKSFSISKSVLSALVGIAQEDGLLTIEDPLRQHVEGLASPELAAIPLAHLLDNVSGLRYARGFAPWKQQPRMYYSPDVRGYVKRARSERASGQRFAAEDLSPLLVGVALEAALRRRNPAATLADFTAQRLWQPMGAEYSASWVLDHAGDGLEKTESGFVARAVDFARFGQLYLDGGRADGRQVVPAAWVEASITAPAPGQPNRFVEGFHRKLWWGAFRPGRERDDFYANGHFGQRIYVCPDKRLVLVRLGSATGQVDWTGFLGAIADAWQVQGSGTGRAAVNEEAN